MKRLLTCIVFFCLFLSITAQERRLPSVAPLNPEYLRTISDPAYDHAETPGILPYHPGFRSLSVKRPPARNRFLPAVYDMRTAGPGGTSLVTPVKNQGGCGSCWAFASLAAIESSWLLQGYGAYDLSENNVKNCHGFLSAPCGYGSNYHTTAVMARGEGPILEADDPYSTTNNTCITGLSPAALITEVLFVPPDVELVKDAIYYQGGVSVPMRIANLNYFNSSDYTYFNTLHTTTNHLITLVGWDDNKKVTGGMFSAYPPPGVFIAKNSYGTSYGESGYFYISYYDLHIIDYGQCYPGREEYVPGTQVYTHSRLGSFYSMGYDDPLGYGLIRFTLDEHKRMVRLGTYVNSGMTEVGFEIYDDFDDVNLILSNKIAELDKLYCHYPGYYSFELPDGPCFTGSNDIYVKVRYYAPGYPWPIPTEQYMSGFCDPVIESNVCWTSGDGSDGSWYLIGGTNPSYLFDLCAYVYTESLTQWQGGNSTAWDDASNWDNGIPDAGMHALISAGTNMPVVSGTAACRSLSIDDGETLTISPGGSLAVNKELALRGSLNNQGSLTVAAGADIIYAGSSAQTIDPAISGVARLIINNPAGVSLSGNLQIAKMLRLKAGSITAGTYSISYEEGAALEYRGQSAQTSSATEFPSSGGPDILLIDNAAGVSLHAARNIDSTLFLINGTFDNSSFALGLADGQSIVRYDGSLAAAPTFGSSVMLGYRSANNIGTGYEIPSSTGVAQDVTINGPGNVTLNSGLTVNGTLALNAGSFDNSGSTLSMAGGSSIEVRAGQLTAAPAFGSSIDLFYLGDIGYASGYEMPSSTTVLRDLTIKNSGGVTLSSNVTVNENLFLISGTFNNSTATLSLASGCVITADPGLLDGYYGYPGKLSAKPTFGANADLVYNGRYGITMGHEMPDSADGVLNNLTINNTVGLTFTKNLTAKGNVEAMGKLRMQSYTISGTGNLNIKRAAVIHTNHPDGIDNSSGTFQMQGVSSYNDTVDFRFEGSSPQYMGADIPPVMRHLVIYNSSTGGVTLQSKDIRILWNMWIEQNCNFTITNGRMLSND